MKTALIFDTETTGFPMWSERSDHKDQPHIVQLAAELIQIDTGRILSSMNFMCRPLGWVIPPATIDIHGIDNFLANEHGIGESHAVYTMLEMLRDDTLIVAHNAQFDKRIIRIALKRFFNDQDVKRFCDREFYCTAQKSKPLCKLPPTEKMLASPRFRNSYKQPKLSEAYKHFTGKELVGAHNAMIDVEACRTVFLALINQPAE